MNVPDGARRRIRELLATERPRLGRYVLNREIARGGMGVVYEADDPELGRRVAVKVLREDDAALADRLRREAAITAGLRHPNIVVVHEVGRATDGGREVPYIAMDYVEGRNLAEVLAAAATPREELLRMLGDVARAVGCAHARGVVHRDLKPANVLVEPGGRVVLTDFGLARADRFGTRLTETGAVMGTPQYMAPEQAEGRAADIDARTDVFALGIMLYEALTGRLPFEAASPARLCEQIVERDPVPPGRLARVDRDVERICLKALEKEPARRYPDGNAFADDLDRYRRGEPVTARPPSFTYRLRKKLARRKGAVAAAAILAALAGIVAVQALRGRSEREALTLLEKARPALEEADRRLRRSDARFDEVAACADRARALIEQAVAKAPDLALAHYLLGAAWERRADTARAEACWRRAVELDGGFAPARYQLGRMLALRAIVATAGDSPGLRRRRRAEAQRHAAEAARELEAALRSGSGFDDELQREIARAILAYAQGRRTDVAHIVREGATRFAGRDGIEELEWLAGFDADPDVSVPALDRVLTSLPKFWPALMMRAEAHIAVARRAAAAGRDDEEAAALRRAHGDLSEVVAFRPGLVLARGRRAAVRHLLGDGRGAMDDCAAVIEREPRSAHATALRGIVRAAAGDRAGAQADLDRAIELDAEDDWSRLQRGIFRRRQGDLSGAEEDVTAAIASSPDWATAYAERAEIRMRREDLEGTLADAEKALALEPRRPSIFVCRGAIRRLKQDFAGAVLDCDRAIEINGRFVAAHVQRGLALEKMGRREEALASFDRALAIREEADTYLYRGTVRAYIGRRSEAVADLTRAIELNPRHAEAHFARGGIRAATGDRVGASEDYRRALEVAPEGWRLRPRVQEELAKLRE